MLSAYHKTSKIQLKSKYGIYIKFCCILVSILSLFALFRAFSTSTDDKNELKNGHYRDLPTNRIGNSNNSGQEQANNNPHDQDRGQEIVNYKYIYSNVIKPEKPINSIESVPPDLTSIHTLEQAFSVNQDTDSDHKSTLRVRRNIGIEIEESKVNGGIAVKDAPISEQSQEQVNKIALDGHYSPISDNTGNHSVFDSNIDNIVTTGQGMNNEGSDRKTLVTATSKSDMFHPVVLPLDDLIVSPATEARVGLTSNDQHPPISSETEVGNQQQESSENQAGFSFSQHQTPNLAELTALGTATGLLLGDLAAQQATLSDSYNPYESGESSRFAHNLALQNAYARNEIPQSYNQPDAQQNVAFDPEAVNYARQDSKQDLENSPENSPDSMESLMRTEEDDMGIQNDQAEDPAERSSSNLVQDENVVNFNAPLSNGNDDSSEDDDDDDSSNERRDDQVAIPQNISFIGYSPPVAGEQFGHPLHPQPLLNGDHQIIVPMRESMNDLNTAAGHYYGKKKKKKKKVIVKKKKIKTVKKKKKKVKIVKYKVKKIKVKKVKKKKRKPVKKHHDHGKYYMYAKAPKKKAWEFGFKKGNKKHWIERHEKGHKNKFKTKVKWYDKKSKGKGMHIWDYNHHDKKKKKHYG